MFVAAAVLTLVALAFWGGRDLPSYLFAFLSAARGEGAWAAMVFIFIYTIGIVAMIPGSVFTMAGGAIFGFVHGTAYSLLAAFLGATLAFLLGRHVARGLVEHRLARMPRFQRIDRAVAIDAIRIIILLRLSPIVPFNILNYALGLTAIRLRDFVLGGVGMVPATVAYTYAGKLMGEAALALAGRAEVPPTASYYAVLAAGFAATVAATIVVTRTARRALSEV